MLIGTYFKQRRLAANLSPSQVAASIAPDFEESLLWDFEDGDDNDIDEWSIQDFKRYCEALSLNPADFADIPTKDIGHLPLPDLVRTRRKEKGYSLSELSEYIGYDESVIEALEGPPQNVTVCMEALKETALWLDIPFRLLLSKI